jgi:hypothetical protein
MLAEAALSKAESLMLSSAQAPIGDPEADLSYTTARETA